MRRLKKLKNGTKQKWNGLPFHHQLAILLGLLIALLIFNVTTYLLNGKLALTQNSPQPFIFRTIVEETAQAKYLILRGNFIGSRGKVCFATPQISQTEECPFEFPIIGWSNSSVRTEITIPSPTTGLIWLINGKGIISNKVELSL